MSLQLNLNHNTGFNTGDALQAEDWNKLASDVNTIGTAINNGDIGGGGSGIVSATDVTEQGSDDHKAAISIDSGVTDVPSTTVLELSEKDDKGVNVSLVGNNNINIEPRIALGTGQGKNKVSDANRKGGNIALKPGDDIEFWAHHRGTEKNDEVSVKIMTEVPKQSDPTKTDEVAAKLQLNAADIVLTSKDKQEQSDEMNITVNKDTDTRGYLKVRAQAIDLRCEINGGIALQPKGNDGDGHENKIKFEHNGGDGLEFGTFNTEKTSIFTDEYRFNGNGKIYAVTRGEPVVTSKKTDYPTQDDDFKDIPVTDKGTNCVWDSTSNQWIIPDADTTHNGEDILSCTWEDLIRLVLYMKNHNQGPWEPQV